MTKADHITALLATAGIDGVRSMVEVGCGDGAVLAELARRGLAETRFCLDISSSAVRIAAERSGVSGASVFDGEHIPAADAAYDLVIATHVLEHVPVPQLLLGELSRVCGQALVIEVPLERNVAARRPAARAASDAAGHLHTFARGQVRQLVEDVGWHVRGELLDPLPLEVHMFAAETRTQRAKGAAKWAVRSALSAVPPLAERLFTLHYALLATPRM